MANQRAQAKNLLYVGEYVFDMGYQGVFLKGYWNFKRELR